MDKRESLIFSFHIGTEIKRSFESPVILLTKKDYADYIFRTLIDIRSALIRNVAADEIAEIINSFHLDWLRAVREVEQFKKRAKDTPREVIQNAIDFTIKCVHTRYASYKAFLSNLKLKISIEDQLIIQADLEIIRDMKESVISVLQEKHTCFKYNADQTEYLVKLNYEIDELLNWLDRLTDGLALQFCKVVKVYTPQLARELSKTLIQVIDEVAAANSPRLRKSAMKIDSKGKLLSSMLRINASHELEQTKVIEKIKELEDRIERTKDDNSSGVLGLQHKVIYLEERLQSLQNLQTSLNALRMEQNKEICEDDMSSNTELRMFNHNLPALDRGRLVERLIKLWDNALTGDETGKSIISILSAADMNQVYTDDIGQFTVDQYGRKIYSSGSTTQYQLNEKNQLVEVNDDSEHVYYYDDCGRYYLSESRTRIYKDHDSASEYELCTNGRLLKLKETIDGIEYRFDTHGRYFIDEEGKRIYCSLETGERYEQDGFGNLVRIHSKQLISKPCPDEPLTVPENKYLQRVVGDALKKCIAKVVLHQPADPIGFLADSLEKYCQHIAQREKRLNDEKELAAERRNQEGQVSAPLQSYVTEEEEMTRSSIESNFQNYKTDMASED